MGERLDAAVTNVQDFVLDRIGGVMTEMEAADLAGRITLLVNESRFPFEMELLDLSHGVVVTVPEQLSVEEVISIKRSMDEKLGPDIKLFVCRGNIRIQKFHADLVLASRRFVDQCYACRGVGEIDGKNCGVCCDIRAALSFFDKHNIPQSREKPTLPSPAPGMVFQEGDPVLYKGRAVTFVHYIEEEGVTPTEEPQVHSLIRARTSGEKIDGYEIREVPTEHLRFDAPEHDQ